MIRFPLSLFLLAGLLLGQSTRQERVVICTDAGSSDSYACTPSPAVSSYTTGLRVRLKANTANTGAATVNISAVGAATIKKVAGGITTDLADNDIRAGQYVDLVYDGTNFQMLSQLGNAGTGTTYTARDMLVDSSGTLDVDAGDVSVVHLREEGWTLTGGASVSAGGEFGWVNDTIGTSSGTYAVNSTATTWPQVRSLKITTGTVNANNGNSLKSQPAFAWGNNTDKPWVLTMVVKAGQADPSTARVLFGMASAGNTLAMSGFGLRYDPAAGATYCGNDTGSTWRFWAYNQTGPSHSCYDTGVTIDTSWVTWRVASDAARGGSTAQKVWFQINGGTWRSACASGCDFTATITTADLFIFAAAVSNAASTAVNVELDFVGIQARVSTSKDDRNP